jgi:hypothetical protein
LLSALRALQKHKGSALLNIVGLSIGMTACILILMWVRYEVEWDQYHEHIDELYLVATEHDHGTSVDYGWGSPPAVAPAFAAEYPEITAATRYTSNYGYMVQYGDEMIDQHRGSRFVDPEFLAMFSLEFISGDPETALDDVHSIVLTESVADQLFGDEDPLDKIVTVEYDHAFRVTAVVTDCPSNSMLRFESLAPIEFIRELSDNPEYIDTWYNCSFQSFLRLRPGTDSDAFNEKIAGRIKQSRPESNVTPFAYPYGDLNLYSVTGQGGYIETVVMISLIALLVLLIACINFMNMATAQAANRAREVGVRKVVGALRRELVGQFYFESMLQSFLAAVLALVLVEQLLPMFRELTTYPLRVDYTGDPAFWGGVAVIALATGFVSGSYPALVLSTFARRRSVCRHVGTGDLHLHRIPAVPAHGERGARLRPPKSGAHQDGSNASTQVPDVRQRFARSSRRSRSQQSDAFAVGHLLEWLGLGLGGQDHRRQPYGDVHGRRGQLAGDLRNRDGRGPLLPRR